MPGIHKPADPDDCTHGCHWEDGEFVLDPDCPVHG